MKFELECLKKLRMNGGELNIRLGTSGFSKYRKSKKKLDKKKPKQKKLPFKYRGKDGYRRYLKTKHWKEFRSNYKFGKCYCCREDGCDLHHIRYNNLFNETDKDVVLLCHECHNNIHNLILNEKEFKLKNAHIYYKKLLYYDNI